MGAMLAICGAMLGGWIGWWLAARFGPTAGFIVSLLGSGLGLYWARRITRYYLG
jgi:predicted esterase YcpF (UPF0227 family)